MAVTEINPGDNSQFDVDIRTNTLEVSLYTVKVIRTSV